MTASPFPFCLICFYDVLLNIIIGFPQRILTCLTLSGTGKMVLWTEPSMRVWKGKRFVRQKNENASHHCH